MTEKIVETVRIGYTEFGNMFNFCVGYREDGHIGFTEEMPVDYLDGKGGLIDTLKTLPVLSSIDPKNEPPEVAQFCGLDYTQSPKISFTGDVSDADQQRIKTGLSEVDTYSLD